MRPEQISQPTQNTAVPAPQVIAPYASELDGGASYTTAGPQIENEPYRPQKQGRRQLLTTAYRSHLWGLIWTVIILILLALLAGVGMKLVGKYRKAPTITNSDGLTSVTAPTGLLGNQLLTVNGQLKVTGLTTLQSGLKVTGPTNLQDDVSVGGNLNVAQNAAVTGTLTAGGLRVLGGVSAPSFQGGNFTGGAVNVTTINAAGTISGGSFTGNGTGLTGVNATLLNGQQESYYLNASNISGGVLGIQYGGTGATTSAGARANLGAAAAGANNDITSLSGLTTALSASQGGTGVDGSTAGPGQILIGNGSGYSLANLTQGSGISITNASGSITIGVDSTVCTTAGNCGTGSGGGITGSGSADTIAMFTGAGSTLGNSLLSQSGSTVSVLGNLSASGSFTATSGTFSGAVSAGSVSTTGAVTAASANVSGNVTAGSFTGNGAGVTNVNAALLNGQAGSYYTNASNLSTGTVADARLSTNVTLQGNTFNGPNQLVQLTATGALPALDGSNVSNVNAASLQGYAASYFTDASNLSSGTLADARLSSNVPLKNTNNTFTGSNTFAGVAATSVSATSMLQNGNTVCDMSGNCAGVGGGVTTSGGTAGVLPVFTGAGSIANSLVSQAGSTVTVAGTLVATALQGSGAGLTSLNGSNIASGTVAVSYGGTGATSFTTNGIIYGNGTGSLQATAAGTSGQCLVATTGSAPSWQSCSAAAGTPSTLAGDVTGPLSSNTVSNLQGSTLTLTTPAAGNFLLFDGAAWVNQSISGDATVSSGGALTVANSAITSAKILDATITAADIAAGTITGSNIASGSVTGSNIAGSTITGSNIAAGTVTNGNLVNSSLTVTAGTGLTGGGSIALGGSATLQVSYGNTAGTAVAGNTTLICPSGTGNLTGGGNTITLGSGGTCNNLSVVASPSFTGLTISSFGAGIITANASGVLSSGSLDRNSALLTGQTSVANGGTGAATAAGARTNLGAAASGANSDITSLSAVTSIGSTSTALTLQGNASTILSATDSGFTTSVGFAAPVANVHYVFPVAAAGTYDICTTAGNCAGVGGGISGSGTNNTIAMFTGSGTIGNSILSQSGTTVTVAGTLAATTLQGSGSGITNLNGANITSGTVGVSVGGTGSTTFTQYGVVYGNGTGALQATVAGTTGQCLVATTSAAPSWVDCVTAASGATPGGPAGGDLSGTYPNPYVTGLAGTVLSVSSLTGGDILIYNGTNWVNAALSGDITVDSAGISTIAAGTVTGAKIAAGTITGSNIASGTIANSNLVNSGLTITAGTGLTGGGAVSLGGSTTLNVNFGSTAGTAVAGNTTLTCPTGTGNLSGGGTVITLGAGGVCGSLSTVASPTFTGLTLSSLATGAVLSDASGNLTYGTIDLGSSSYVSGTLGLTNGGTGATTAAGARTNLGAAASGANSDITSLSGLTTMLSAGQGGTGVDGATAANGQLLIGNGSGYTLANLTQGSNIAITNAAGSITIGLTGTVPVTNGGTGAGAFTANGLVYGNGTGALQATAAGTTGQCLIANTGAAPTWGSCSGSAGVTTSSSGTAGTIAMFTGTSTIADSIMTQSGSIISVAGTLAATTLQGDGALVTNVDAVSLGGNAPSYYTNASNLSAGVVPTGRISGTYSGLTGTGALTSGSIGTGFGAISTGSAISTTAALQGNTLSIGSGTFTVDATGAITAATGITSSGTVTLSSLGTGVVKATGGVLSTGTVTLGTDTSGAYVAALGTLTGLTTTGNSGAGSTPSLSVTYGAAAGTAAQGNTALSFTGSGNLTGTVSGTAGGGFSTNTLAIVNNPTFSGLLTANGGVAATTGSFSGTVTLSSLGAGIVQTNASGVVSSATVDRNSALLTGQTSVANGGTGASTAAGARTNLGAAASGANTDITSLANTTSVGSTSAALTLQGNASTVLSATDSGFTTSVGFAVPTANVSYLFDTAAAGTYNICTTAGNCSGVGGGVTTSGGTNGTIAMFTGSQTIANSILSQSGSTVTVAGTLAATTLQGSGSGITNLNGTNITSGTVGVSVGGTGTTTFTQYGVVYGNGTGALQATVAGTTGQCLVGNTSGAPSWVSCASAGGGSTPGGSAGGDLSGTYPNPTVSGLSGTALSISSLTSGDMLIYNGTNWVNASLSGDLTVTGAGVATIANGAVTGAKIAAATITGSNIASSTVTNANLVNSSLTVNAGTGLTGGGSVALGGSITLNVAYGSTATTAVAGNTTLTCPTGTGNLTGGGNTITLGSGGTCGSLSTVASPTFSGLTLSGLTTAGIVVNDASGNLSTVTSLPVANGGTGTTSVGSAGSITYSNGTSLAFSAVGGTGQCLMSGGTGAPTWGACATGGAGSYIQNGLTNQTNANFNITSNAATNVTGVVRAFAGQTADLLQFQNSSATPVSGVDANGNWYIANSGYKQTLQSATLTANQTITMPNASGTVITTGNLTNITAVGTVTSGTWNGSTVGTAYGGTGATTFTSGGVLYGNGSGAILATAAGTTGQCLVATTGSAPSWQSCASASGTLAGDVTGSLGANTLSKIQNTTLTISSLTSGNFLQYNGTDWVNQSISGDATVSGSGVLTVANGAITGAKIASGTITNSNLSSGSYGNITGVGTLGTLTVSGAASTGALTASSIRDTGLTAGAVLSDASGNLSSGTINLASSTYVSGTLAVANGGTGSTTAAGARTNLGAAASGANSDITSLSGLTTALSVGQGGTNATSIGTAGSVAYSTGTAYAFSAAGTSGQCLTSGGSGAPTWTTCTGAGSGNSLQTAYLNSVGGTTPEITLDATRTTLDIQAYSGQTADLLNLRAYSAVGLGSVLFGVSNTGAVTLAGGLTVTGGGAAITGNSTISGTLTGLTGLASSGTVQFSALGTGVVLSNGSGQLSSGTINLASGSYVSGTLAVANGGTGLTSAGTAGTLVYSNGSAFANTAQGTSGQCLISNGSGAPTWTSCASAAGVGSYINNQTTNQTSANFNIQTGAVGNVTGTIRALASQTADLLQFQNSAGAAFSGVNTAGNWYYANSGFTSTTQSAALTANRTITLPDATGTVITTGNLSSITATGTITSGAWNGTTVGIAYGGTGNTAYTTNGVNFYDGTKIASTAAGTTGQCLVGTTGSAPTWQSCSTAAGTPTTLAGDVTGALGSNTVSKLQNQTLTLGAAVTGNFLQYNGTAWVNQSLSGDLTVTGAGVATIAAGAVTGTKIANNTITNANLASGSFTNITGVGTLTAGTWNASAIGAQYGGTGQSTYAVGDLLYANTTTSLAKLADVAAGQCLLSGGVNTAPAYGTCVTAEADTLASVTARGTTTSTAVVLQGGATIRGLTVDSATGTNDKIALAVTTTAGSSFTGTITNADLTAARTYTLPNASGTLAVSATGPLSLNATTGALSLGTVGIANGGTGITTVPTNGQLLIGNGTNYTVATLGATGLTATPGAGSLSLAVNYGSTANTAVQGNTTLTCPTITGTNLTGGGGTITLGSGGSCTAIGFTATPTFTSGTFTGANALTLGTTGASSGSIAFKNATGGSGTITLQSGYTGAGNYSVSIPSTIAANDTICLVTLANCVNPGANTSLSNLSAVNIGTTALNSTSNNLNLTTTTSGNIVLNSAGTIELQDNTNVTGAFSATGNINSTAGALQLNGVSINTAGTLTNVAYLNQANMFTAAQTVQLNSASALSLNNSLGNSILRVDTTNKVLQLGAANLATTVIRFNTSVNAFNSTLGLVAPTVGNQTFNLPDMAAAGTYTLLTSQTAATGFIQNQNTSAQTANIWINGTARADTAVITPAIRPAADGTTAFQIQNAAGTQTMLNVDTTNLAVSLVNVATAQQLSVNDWRTGSTLSGKSEAYWQSISSSADGTKLAAVVDGGSIYTSTDSGATWTERTSAGSRNWYSITSSADGTKLATAEYGGSIYTSTDSGATWTERTGAGSRDWQSITSSTDGTKLAAVVNGGSIYTSTDSGATWTERTSAGSQTWQSITSSADGTKLAAAVYYGSIYTSTDSGATWTERTSAGSRFWRSITSSADGTKLAAAAYYDSIYTSTDSGATWTERTSAGSNSWQSITSSADGTKLAAAVYNGSIYTSTDSGATWTERTSSGSRSWGSITSSADGTKLAAAEYGGSIYTSTDSGATWTERTSAGSQTWRSITSSADGTKLAAVVSGGSIYTSTDSGVTWTERTSAGSRYWQSITSSSDGTKLAAVVNGGSIYTSTDSGATWTERTGAGSRSWYSITPSSDGTKLAAVVNGGSIYTSTDSGATWTERTSAGSRGWYSITSSADGTKLAAAVYGGSIYTSTDSGATWTERTSAGSRNWASITSSADGTKLAAVVYGGSIYTSTDSGATWTERTSAGSNSWYSITSSADGTKLAAVVDSGSIYTSSDSGATWTERTSAGSRYWQSITSSADGTKLAAVVYMGKIYTLYNGPQLTVTGNGAYSGNLGVAGALQASAAVTDSLFVTGITVLQGLTQVNLSADSGANLVCQNSANQLSVCASTIQAPTAANFIQNQHTAAQSTSQFWLSGDGRTDTSFTTPLLQSAAGAALSVDSGTTGALNIGTGANAKTITVGNTTSGTTTKLQAGVTSITTTNSGVIVSATAAQSSAFQIQNASSAAIFNVDTTNSAIDITGSLALKRGSDFTTTGTSNDVNFGNVSLVRLNGSSAQTITGIANGRDGYMLTIVNAANQTATIANSSTSSVAANRIITGTGANVGLVPGASAQLVYDSGSNMWRIVGAVTSNGVPAVRAYSTTSTILTAASGTYYAVPFNTELIDTDVMHDNVTDNTRFYAKTAGVYKISATIRYASNGMGGSTGVYTRLVMNGVGVLALTGDGASSTSLRTSTATVMKYFNVGDYIVVQAYQDTGANMNVLGGTEDATSFDMYRIDGGLDNSSTMGGVTTVGTLDGGTRNATGASIASNNFYLQSAGTDYAGLVNTTAQTFGGVKTFNNGLVSTSLTAPTVQSAAGTALLVDSGTTGALNIGTSANAKTITIGNNTGATALNLVAGTGKVNITGTLVTGSQAADPTGVAGAMYYNSTTGTFRCYQAGIWQNCMGALYTTAADSTALNGGTTGAQFFSTAYSMPANYCTQGRAIHLSVGGVTTSTTTAQAMRFAVYVGGTQIGQAAATYTPTASQTNAAWFMDYTFTCRAAPSAASAIYGQGTVATQLTPTTAAVTNHIVPSNFAGVNVATNAAANIQIAVTYTGTANAANTVTLKQLVINSY